MGNAHVKPHPRTKNKKQVHWKAAARPPPPGKPQLVAEAETTPDVVTIKWTKPPTDGGSPITGYLVEHRRTGSPHWVRATPLLVQLTETTLSGLEPGWRYQFRICAENAVGLSDPSELSEPITVTLQRSAITAPRFTQELQETTALENEKTEFMVHFLGQPPPKVCWYKDAFEIFSSRRIRIVTENDRSVLTFHQCSLSDEGEIKCTATNKAGHVATKAKLTVEAPPSIRLPRQYEDGLLFEIGELIRLKVSVAGRPTPLVFWSHNGESIKSDDRYEIEDIDKSSVLKINEAEREDRGEYKIKAVNKLGEDVQTFLVTVTDKPSPPGKARVVMALGRSVTLSWSRPADDGGSKIGNYIVEYFRMGWNVWLKAATSRQLTTMLGDLIEGSEYKFRVKAESPYGVSEPSEESEVVFIPDPKRGLLQPPTTRAKSQPREILQESAPPAVTKRKNKPRSQSSSRVQENTLVIDKSLPTPKRPDRIKVKSPNRTPEASPKANKRQLEPNINKEMFDKSSVARELAYGSPDIRIKKEIEPNINDLDKSLIDKVSNSIDKPPTVSPVSDNHAIYKVKIESSNESSPVKALSLSPEIGKKQFSRENSENLTGSSEFMLVLYPGENERGQSGYEYDDDDVPPPMSLSAPELGADSPIFNQLKTSCSSSELLHERAMIRLYQDAESEERELENQRKSTETARRKSLDIPKIQINSKDDENIIGLDRNESLKRRRMSAGALAQQKMIIAQRRHSLKTPAELKSEIGQQKLPQTAEEKRETFTNRQRSESEEMEEQAFEAVRKRMNRNGPQNTEKRSIAVANTDIWGDDYESSTDELTEESSEDERKNEVLNVKQRYSDEEEETYHPGPVRSQLLSNKEPFEILTVRKEPPSPDFVPKPILKKNEHDEMIKNTVSPPPSPNKVRASSPVPSSMFQRDRSASLVETPQTAPENLKTLFEHSQPPPKPRQRSFSLLPQKQLLAKTVEHPEKLIIPEKPKSPEHPSPFSLFGCISEVAKISGITAASIVIPDTLLQKQKDAEEAKVVADHYGDIVKSYGGRRRSTTEVLTDMNSLKRAAGNTETPHASFNDSFKIEPKVNNKISSQKDVYTEPVRSPTTIGNEKLMNVAKQPQNVKPTDHIELTKENHYPSLAIKLEPSRKSPSRSSPSRSPTLSRRSPVKSQNWDVPRANQKGNPSTSPKRRSLPRKTSPSPMRKIGDSPMRKVGDSPMRKVGESPMRKGRKTSPSPLRQQIKRKESPSAYLRTTKPMLREIMTQTSEEIFDYTSSDSRASSPSGKRDELMERAKVHVRSWVDYLTDLAMLIVASWFYFFSNELYAIPILFVLVYRQLKEEMSKRIPKWLLRRLKKEKNLPAK